MNPIKKTATLIKDAALLEELNKALPVQKDDKPRNGFWALASVEDPNGDEDGDVICVDGITSDLDPAAERYLPLLAGHQRKLPTGMAPEIGRIEMLQKTRFKDMPALAMYFTFALDESGVPVDDMVKSYYDRYRLGFSNAFSVGMESTGEPEKIAKGGFRYKSTKLYEVSSVSIGANQLAVGLTRAKDDEDELLKLVKGLTAKVDGIGEELTKAIEERFDELESALEVKKGIRQLAPTPPAADVTKGLREMLDRLSAKKA